MCPFYWMRGRQAGGGRPGRRHVAASWAAKISERSLERSNHFVCFGVRPLGRCAGNLRCTQPTARVAEALLEFYATSAILSAHCDGLEIEDQLTCGALDDVQGPPRLTRSLLRA